MNRGNEDFMNARSGTARSGPRSHDTTAIFAMLIISRDFIMDDVPMLVVESIEKPSRAFSLSSRFPST